MNRQDAMTSEEVLLSKRRFRVPRRALRVLPAVVLLLLAGCDSNKVTEPTRLTSPYPAPKVWAVAPFHNESGTRVADPVRFADKLTQQLQQVDGIDMLPVNRVLEAMQAEQLAAPPGTIAEAMRLMQRLDADGVIVGTITGWDPYDPPKIGASIALFSRHNPAIDGHLDTRALTASPTGTLPAGTTVYTQPVAQAGNYFDAANGTLIKQLQSYAAGRTPIDSPAGWRRYLLSMDLYAEFVSHALVRELLDAEWWRITYPEAAQSTAERQP
jgi:hypothetical protein